jgi:hypothetical protein
MPQSGTAKRGCQLESCCVPRYFDFRTPVAPRSGLDRPVAGSSLAYPGDYTKLSSNPRQARPEGTLGCGVGHHPLAGKPGNWLAHPTEAQEFSVCSNHTVAARSLRSAP